MNHRYKRQICLKQTQDLEIWKALDEVSLQPVLLKTLHHGAPPTLSHQFRMEEQVLSALNSPWIPRLLDMEQTAEGMSLIETWLEGEQLDVWLARRPGMGQKRRIFEQLVELVDLVHQAGFLYLDLKPDNVLIVQNHACLIDFNACVLTGSQHALLSNPDALPPEHAQERLDERADQIGLGRLHQRLFGPHLIGWKCLQTHPDQRFSSLQALKQAMRMMQGPRLLLWMGLLAVLGTGTGAWMQTGILNGSGSWLHAEADDPVGQESAAASLYADLEAGRLDPKALEQEAAAEEMVALAAASEHEWLAAALLQTLSPALLDDHPLWSLRLSMLSRQDCTEQQVETWLEEIPFSDQPGTDLAWLALYLHQNQTINGQGADLMECAGWIEEWKEDDALLFVQCLLQDPHHAQYPMPPALQTCLQNTASGPALLSFWEQPAGSITQGQI